VRTRVLIAVLAALCTSAPAAAATGRIAADPLQGLEWWLHDIGADQATPPGPGVPVVVVDSGVDATHPEFSGRANTTFLDDQTVDGVNEYHGTAVASLVGAPQNGVGIVGVYPQAVLGSWDASPTPGISDLSVIVGIETIAQHCPAVINLSFGGTTPDPALDDAILLAVHNGCLVVAASGNGGDQGDLPTFPASYPHVLTVGATDEHDASLTFSTYGPWVDLAAPGVDMVAAVPLSHDPSGYSSGLEGTSFSAPLVSAAAAWIWTVRPTLSVSQLGDLLRASARRVGASGFDPHTGYGIVDIPNALAAPTPPNDPQEPNDDIDEVEPGAMFADGQQPLTSPARASNRIAGTLDAQKDPRDVYRIWVPPHRIVRVSVAGSGNAAARIWGPRTVSTGEGLAARRRDLRGPQIGAGNTGFYAYAEVLPTGRSDTARYVLTVTASRR
jgi:Subtilase family